MERLAHRNSLDERLSPYTMRTGAMVPNGHYLREELAHRKPIDLPPSGDTLPEPQETAVLVDGVWEAL